MVSIDQVVIYGDSLSYEKLLRPVFPQARFWTGGTLTPNQPEVNRRTLVVLGDVVSEGYDLQATHFDRHLWSEFNLARAWFLGFDSGCNALYVLDGGRLMRTTGVLGVTPVVQWGTGEQFTVGTCSRVAPLSDNTTGVHVHAANLTAYTQTWYDEVGRRQEILTAEADHKLVTIMAWSTYHTLGIHWRPDLTFCPVAGRVLFYNILKDWMKG